MIKWKPQDFMTIIIVSGCLVSVIMGVDGAIKFILLVVVGAYYGLDLTPFIKLGRNQGKKKE